MASFKHKNVEIYYEIHGEGAPLVLVAGLASDSQSWLSVREQLASKYQVIIFDNRCVGRTMPQVVETSISLMAGDCMALIKHLGLGKVSILGHSLGSFIAIECAAKYPETIENLMLAGSSYYFSERNKALISDWALHRDVGMDQKVWLRNLFYWLFRSEFFNDPAVVDIALDCAISYPHQQSKDAFRNQAQCIDGYCIEEKLPMVKANTLVIGGEHDLIFPKEDSCKLAELIADSQCKIIPDAAHSIHVDNPEGFCEAVCQFLS